MSFLFSQSKVLILFIRQFFSKQNCVSAMGCQFLLVITLEFYILRKIYMDRTLVLCWIPCIVTLVCRYNLIYSHCSKNNQVEHTLETRYYLAQRWKVTGKYYVQILMAFCWGSKAKKIIRKVGRISFDLMILNKNTCLMIVLYHHDKIQKVMLDFGLLKP